MSRSRVLLVLAALLTALPLAPAPASAAVVWSDEFNGPAGGAPDQSKWSYEPGNGNNGWGNHELQAYTTRRENVSTNGAGQLVITARRENSGVPCWNGQPCQYTSGKLITKNTRTFTYGRVEARMKLPTGKGIWPAFWMLGTDIGQVGWPQCGEIDIMENIGSVPNTVHGTLHGPGYSGAGGIGATAQNARPFHEDFHTFAVDWSPNRIVWSVDGRVYQTRTPADLGGRQWVFNHPFYLILNLAVGGDWPGSPDGSTRFPQQLLVDWVRVHQG
ncbi:glycoside hydrolase family 16 protein [Allokutzneria albata]|uniref:Glycosyl hydrolases family 16 n=1 Tax=Allokutzneria albata TaxID=211114 RepID=A0A1G9R5C4_ALLAB|nr:glycoside hydrolase family 16 protein [Allokutzneria albata]SDM18413.1 Glycosyl hydrolases family 16 [Allokutzneria albata]